MNLEKANKIIAEYMHNDTSCSSLRAALLMCKYHESLDALVPVWEKLNYFDNEEEYSTDKEIYFKKWFDNGEWLFDFGSIENGVGFGKTIQAAACIATAKAIKELG